MAITISYLSNQIKTNVMIIHKYKYIKPTNVYNEYMCSMYNTILSIYIHNFIYRKRLVSLGCDVENTFYLVLHRRFQLVFLRHFDVTTSYERHLMFDSLIKIAHPDRYVCDENIAFGKH